MVGIDRDQQTTHALGGAPPVIATVTRGSITESALRGMVAVVDASGRLTAFAGDVERPVYFRSAAKPFQALPLVTSGAADAFRYTSEELALACASHNAAPKHLSVAVSMLGKIGLSDLALRCGFAMPNDEEEAARITLGLVGKTALHCECSGKHAGMLAVCRRCEYPTSTYLDPEHPLQRQIRGHIAHATGVAEDDLVMAVDGCGLPTYAAPLRAFAVAYASIAAPDAFWDDPEATALTRLRDAMLEHPELISGDGEADTELMRLTGGRVLAKLGAEGLLCLAVPERGIGIAISDEGGSSARGLGPAAVRVLDTLGLLDAPTLEALKQHFWTPVKSFAGEEVGHVESTFNLETC